MYELTNVIVLLSPSFHSKLIEFKLKHKISKRRKFSICFGFRFCDNVKLFSLYTFYISDVFAFTFNAAKLE